MRDPAERRDVTDGFVRLSIIGRGLTLFVMDSGWLWYSLTDPRGRAPESVFRLSLTCSLINVLFYGYISLVCLLIHFWDIRYGADAVFEWWIRGMQGPLTFFEGLTFRGKQLASSFYFTSMGSARATRNARPAAVQQ